MIICRTREDLTAAHATLKNAGKTIGFVPTMGALHDGHLSLITLAQQHADATIASIYVNPTQFAPHEDFDSYPRHEDSDLAALVRAGTDVAFLPTEDVIYADGRETTIKAGDAGRGLETDFRPHFFDGVVNVVYRLFSLVKPDIAVFGEKDYQQLQVIQQMVENEAMPIRILGAPIARDDHGLALSSRNAYLSDKDLDIARQLNVILRHAAESGDLESAKTALLEAGFDHIDYIESRWNRTLAAAWLGKTRLIDNVAVV